MPKGDERPNRKNKPKLSIKEKKKKKKEKELARQQRQQNLGIIRGDSGTGTPGTE